MSNEVLFCTFNMTNYSTKQAIGKIITNKLEKVLLYSDFVMFYGEMTVLPVESILFENVQDI